jgi:hypothetical protein
MTYWELLPHVHTRTDFVRFVGLLAVDAEVHSEEWSSSTIAGFLDSLAVWTSATSTSASGAESVSWHAVAEMLAAARVYEA